MDRRAHSIRSANRAYGIDRGTLAAAIHRGELPASRLGKRRLIILDDHLRAWIAAHRVLPASIEQRVEAALEREGHDLAQEPTR